MTTATTTRTSSRKDAKRAAADARKAAAKDNGKADRKAATAASDKTADAPTVEVADGKKAKKTKDMYPGLKDGKLKEAPKDFDPKLHKPLKRSNFEDEACYWDWRVMRAEADVTAHKEQARICRELGSKADRKKAQRVAKLRDQMAELVKDLSGQGIDIEALLAAAGK